MQEEKPTTVLPSNKSSEEATVFNRADDKSTIGECQTIKSTCDNLKPENHPSSKIKKLETKRS